jgi:hypothetical protein
LPPWPRITRSGCCCVEYLGQPRQTRVALLAGDALFNDAQARGRREHLWIRLAVFGTGAVREAVAEGQDHGIIGERRELRSAAAGTDDQCREQGEKEAA